MYKESKGNRYGWNFINPSTDLVDFQVVLRGPDKGHYLWDETYNGNDVSYDGGHWRRLYGAAKESTYKKYLRLSEEYKNREREAKLRKENTEF